MNITILLAAIFVFVVIAIASYFWQKSSGLDSKVQSRYDNSGFKYNPNQIETAEYSSRYDGVQRNENIYWNASCNNSGKSEGK